MIAITMHYVCRGCDAKAEADAEVRYGLGHWNLIHPDPWEGWVAFDPYTRTTYCPECWASITCADEATP